LDGVRSRFFFREPRMTGERGPSFAIRITSGCNGDAVAGRVRNEAMK
jgi:hypothetical protein